MDLVISHVSKDFGRGPVLRDVSLTVRQGETVCLMGPRAWANHPCCGAWPGWSGRKAAPSPVFRRGLAMCSRRTGCAASFPPWPTSAWQQAGPCRRSSGIWRSWAWPAVPGGRCRSCPAGCAAGWPSPGPCAGPQLLLLDEAFKGLDEQCRRGHRGLYPPPHAGGVPAVRHPRPGGGRPAGAAVWTCPPYDCDMEPKNVSHSETFR